jgi:hypothetical protein
VRQVTRADLLGKPEEWLLKVVVGLCRDFVVPVEGAGEEGVVRDGGL